MTPPNSFMDKLLSRLQKDYPHIEFVAGKAFYWSPATRQIFYKTNAAGPTAVFSLLHEVGHALLGHKRYKLDFELLELEVAAWERAGLLAKDYAITIDGDHIQDCLDTYRDWLYRRSICPSCTTKALQQDDEPVYNCYNCHATWRVAPSRFCRPYRQTKDRQPTVFASSQPSASA
jgi:hypothetical protein